MIPFNISIKEFESCLSSNFFMQGLEMKVRQYHYNSVVGCYPETIR